PGGARRPGIRPSGRAGGCRSARRPGAGSTWCAGPIFPGPCPSPRRRRARTRAAAEPGSPCGACPRILPGHRRLLLTSRTRDAMVCATADLRPTPMTLAFRSDETSPFVRALFADQGIAPGEVPLEIDGRDEMLEFLLSCCEGDRERALFTYFRSGLSIAETLVQVLRGRFGDLGRIERLMDFACGYGRVTRFLLRHFPDDPAPAERVWV